MGAKNLKNYQNPVNEQLIFKLQKGLKEKGK